MTFCKKNRVKWSLFGLYIANIVRRKSSFIPIFDDLYILMQAIWLLDLFVSYSGTFGLSIRGKRTVQNQQENFNFFLKIYFGN